TKRNRFMPFLLAEILNFQGSTHRIGVGSFSYQLERHTIEKNLIEDEKLTLFEAQNQYYMSLNFHSISLRLSGKNVNRLDKGVGHIVCQVGLCFKVLCSPVKLAFFWDIEQFKLYATVRIVVGIEVN
ncbi:hypothetical protein ACTNEY_14705, partial [Fusicatenibacter saccharivorans]